MSGERGASDQATVTVAVDANSDEAAMLNSGSSVKTVGELWFGEFAKYMI